MADPSDQPALQMDLAPASTRVDMCVDSRMPGCDDATVTAFGPQETSPDLSAGGWSQRDTVPAAAVCLAGLGWALWLVERSGGGEAPTFRDPSAQQVAWQVGERGRSRDFWNVQYMVLFCP